MTGIVESAKKLSGNDCKCYQNFKLPEQTATGSDYYYPRLKDFATYSEVLDVARWKLAGGEKVFNLLRCDTSGIYPFNDGIAGSFSIISDSVPIKLIHPGNTFTINLTPCINIPQLFRMQVHLNYHQPSNGFDYKKFDHTSLSYLHILLEDKQMDADSLLVNILDKMVNNDSGDGMAPLIRFIIKTNKKYHTKIAVPKPNSYDEGLFAAIVRRIKAKVPNLELFINDEIVNAAGAPHTINVYEESRLQDIFYVCCQGIDFKHFDRDRVLPQYSASFNVTHLGININAGILRRWDDANNKPMIDEAGKPVAATILANVSAVECGTTDGFTGKIEDVCFSTSEITGTGIILNFTQARLITTADMAEDLLLQSGFPLFEMPTAALPKKKRPVEKGMQYDTLLTNFSGIVADSAEIHFAFKNDTLYANAKKLLINNKLVAGEMAFNIEPAENPDRNHFKIKGKNGDLTTGDTEFENYLKAMGLNQLRLIKTKSALTVYFKKIIL